MDKRNEEKGYTLLANYRLIVCCNRIYYLVCFTRSSNSFINLFCDCIHVSVLGGCFPSHSFALASGRFLGISVISLIRI